MQALPGFRDFPPHEFGRRAHIQRVWREAAARHGFSEYDGPPLEPVELYTKKSGDEIVGQLYAFEDKGGRHVALRPEITPTLARLAAEHHRRFRKPMKWFAMPQVFRYERQQKGRLREHFQFNADLLGNGPKAAEEAEILALLIGALCAFGLGERDFRVRMGSRPLWHAALEALGSPAEAHPAVFAVIDKIERTEPEKTLARLEEAGLTKAQAARVVATANAASLDELREMGVGLGAAAEGMRELMEGQLGPMGLLPFVALDMRIIRGLAYYTGTVFEVFALDAAGGYEGRAIAGGGRYDDLLKLLAGVDLPSVGFGMGDVVLGDLLEAKGLLPRAAGRIEVFVLVPSPDLEAAALDILGRLRGRGVAADRSLKAGPLGKQFEAAAESGAAFAVLPPGPGASEIEVKDMQTRVQRVARFEELVEWAERNRGAGG